jgi:hypothetical protein
VLLLSYTPASEKSAERFIEELELEDLDLEPITGIPTEVSNLHQEILLRFLLDNNPLISTQYWINLWKASI